MNLTQLLSAWSISPLRHCTILSGGTNNQVWRVETIEQQAYVLRITPDIANLARIRYEAALLDALEKAGLPFQLPHPLRAKHGDSFVLFEKEAGDTAIATLTLLLPGSIPERNDAARTAQAAIALALLDTVLATLPISHPLVEEQGLPKFGEISHCHPLVPNPLAAVERLPVASEHIRRVQSIILLTMEKVDGLYSDLPQQLLHRDYDPGNMLMDGQRVTAILDFEFAAPDIRVLDLSIALSWWPAYRMGTGEEWELVDAFGSTYTAHFPLSREELISIPDVLRLRDIVSLIHRTGRYFAGLETDERMGDRINHSLWREEWLASNHEKLIQHALAWDTKSR